VKTPAPLRVAWRAGVRFHEHSGPDRAAAVAYYTLLSLLPLLIFSISLGGLVFGSFDDAYNATVFLFHGVVVHLDPRSMEALRSFVEHAVRFQWPSIFLLAWTARRSFSALFGALCVVFGVPGRSFASGNLIALAAVAVSGIGLLLTLTLTTMRATLEGTFLRYAAQVAPGAHLMPRLLDVLLTQLLPVLITLIFFFTVYRIVPRRAVSTRYAWIGALLAAVLWETAKAGFAYYVRNLAQYSGIYGTLEGLIVLALWLELSVGIVLYCGEVVALLIPNGQRRADDPPPIS
jgi:membrane protein